MVTAVAEELGRRDGWRRGASGVGLGVGWVGLAN